MGKMKFNGGANQPAPIHKEDNRVQLAMERVLAEHNELLHRLAIVEAKEVEKQIPAPMELMAPTILEQKVVEKTEVVKEVSIKTTDRRARKHSIAIRSDIKRLGHSVEALRSYSEGHEIDIKNLQQMIYKLQKELEKVSEKERKLEVQISEEKQPVKQPSQMLPMILSGLAVVASLLTLIIK